MKKKTNFVSSGKKYGIYIKGFFLLCTILSISGCSKEKEKSQAAEMKEWLIEADLAAEETKEELYEAALLEDTLMIYSVSTRIFDVKKSFEEEYPGLTVDVKDIRGNDVLAMLKENYKNETYLCDLVICSGSDGALYKELIEPGIIYPYFPFDILPNMKPGHAEKELTFLGETLMLFYNSQLFEQAPIGNLWELTEEKYKGKIVMANPLNSFSSYGFCATILEQSALMEQAYEQYAGKSLEIPEGKNAGEVFWEQVTPNFVFTNSSDEVLEMIGKSKEKESSAWIGIMISSKMRYQALGYQFEPIYQGEPFTAVYTPNSVMIAGGAKNVHAAKLFIRYLLGESEGTGNGWIPFSTEGTWSARMDVADGNEVPFEEMDVVFMDKEYLYANRERISEFWQRLLKENLSQ